MSTDTTQNNNDHKSVMINEVLKYIDPQDDDVIVDGTFGAGGHTKAILDSADCKVIAIDRDSNTKKYIKKIIEKSESRFTFIDGKFGDMYSLLSERKIGSVDGILLDIGVSSMQLDNGDRGFSFQKDGVLDMRMSDYGETAADVVNGYPEEELADIIYKYGDERKSRRIAKAITEYRKTKSIETTLELACIVKKSADQYSSRYNDTINPATRTFQALRIYVNDELKELEKALDAAEKLLSEGGRLVVITFHSGEDIILKQFLRYRSGRMPNISRHLPEPYNDDKKEATFSLVVNKAIKPSKEEIASNPRSRSAKMRVAKRVNVSSSGNFDNSINVQVGG